MYKNGKLAILKLDGDFECQGFRVTLEIGPEGERPQTEMTGLLPPDPELATRLDRWQKTYRTLGALTRIKPQEIIYGGSVNQFEECLQLANQLGDRLSVWLESLSFRALDKRLREELSRNEPIRLLIRSENPQIPRLPWYLWDFFERYPKAEVAFSAPAFERVETAPRTTLKQKVRILAILGNSKGINIQADRRLLETLPDAEVVFLVEPQPQKISEHLWEQAWDILFFAGHSKTEKDRGRIYLNPQDSLTIEELKYGLKKAIAGGLQLAIFNSCDGLGLAQELEQLHLPQIIVMREPVPDFIAQEFLKYFLNAFASGDSLYLAQRQARERLQGWERDFPCASWLPVIYQNPAAVPPDWQGLRRKEIREKEQEQKRVSRFGWRGFKTAFAISAAIASLLIGVRSLGLLQTWELQAFDQLMRLRPTEEPDERILVVTIDEADIQYQQQMGMNRKGSLADQALAQLLQKLTPHQPRVIGSDIVHDFPFESGLGTVLKQTEQFVAICRIKNSETDLVGISPPPGIPLEQLGFTNLSLDPDDAIRRQLLGMSPVPNTPCQTDQSFSFRIARLYLGNPTVQVTPEELRIGSAVFKRLKHHSGGYQLPPKEAQGYQILLNYRASLPQQIPLREILNGAMDSQLPELVKDRIVLLGIARQNQDLHFTPYSMGKLTRRMPGVVVHAQMIAQILSAVLDRRSLLWWWPQWVEMIWIGSWSFVGGVAVLLWRSPRHQGLALLTALVTLSGCSFVLFLKGGWVPLVPSALGLVATGVSVMVYPRILKS